MVRVKGRRLGWAVSLVLLLGMIALTAVAAYLAAIPARAGRLSVGAPDVWVEDVQRAVELSDEGAAQVLVAVRQALARAPGSGLTIQQSTNVRL
jgi:hypothetical protein